MDSTSQNEKIYDDVIYPTKSPSEDENTCISDGPIVTKEGTEINSELQFQPVPPPRLIRSRSTLRKRPSMTGADSNMTSRGVYVSQVQETYIEKQKTEGDNSFQVPSKDDIINSQTTSITCRSLTDTAGNQTFVMAENGQDSVKTASNQNLATIKKEQVYIKSTAGKDLAENICEKEKDTVETVDSQDLAKTANRQDLINGDDDFPLAETADNQRFAGNGQRLVQNEDGRNCLKISDNQSLTDTADSETLLKTDISQKSELIVDNRELSEIEAACNYVKVAHDQRFGGIDNSQELPFVFEGEGPTNISDDQSSSNTADDQSSSSSTDSTAIDAVEKEAEGDTKDVVAVDRRAQSLSALHVKRASSFSTGSDYATMIYPNREIQQVKKSVSLADDIGRRHIRNEVVPSIVNADEAAENLHELQGNIGHDLIGETAVANETDIEVSSNGTREENDVQVNVPITSGVHTLHIHMSFNFLQSYPESKLGRANLKTENKQGAGKLKQNRSVTTGHYKETEDLQKNESNTKDIFTKAPDIPPKKPVVISKTAKTFEKPKVHRALKAKSEGNIATSSTEKHREKVKTHSLVLSENKLNDKQGADGRSKPSIDIVYDEILKEPNEPGYEAYSEANPDETQINSQSILRAPDLGSNPAWLFDHTQREAAEDTINMEQDGSFFVIAEDKETIPFTPYTLMVVHGGQLIRIPVLKHQLIQNRMIQTREKYSLASSPTQKTSIESLVKFFQNHDIGGLKLRLSKLE